VEIAAGLPVGGDFRAHGEALLGACPAVDTAGIRPRPFRRA
jgi:hypothetical protein